jgi:hypothetical protein
VQLRLQFIGKFPIVRLSMLMCTLLLCSRQADISSLCHRPAHSILEVKDEVAQSLRRQKLMALVIVGSLQLDKVLSLQARHTLRRRHAVKQQATAAVLFRSRRTEVRPVRLAC